MGRCVPRVPLHRLILMFLFLSEIFSSAGESSVQDLIGAVGDSVTFPFSVPVSGTIMYKAITVGQVFNKQSDTNTSEKFVNRLQWVSQSGFFTLSDLRTDDSGRYTVESTKEQKGKQEYQLEVYERVSAPQLMNTTSSSSEFCSFLCSVRNVRGLKLSVYEDAVLLNHTSSSSNTSDITLNLHLEIKKTNNHRERTFSCVASNPVSNKTTPFITHSCSLNTEADDPRRTGVLIAVICTVVLLAAVIVMVAWLCKKKQNESSRRREDSSASEGLREEVQYSEINHKKHTQPNISERLSEEACQLTTVYDQIRPERTSDYSDIRTE